MNDTPRVTVPVALPLKLIDTLKPLAIVAEKLKHCHVVEVCEPTADNPSRTTIPMPREWFERTADDLEAIAILMHGAGVLSEGQAATLTGLDRIEVRKQVDALTAAPVREEGGAVLEDALDTWIIEGIKKADQRLAEIDPAGCCGMTSEDVQSGRVAAYQKGFQNGVKSTLTDASFVIMNAALATREEDPAGAGERDALIRELSDAARWRRLPGHENHHATAALFERAISALRAQPPAREGEGE